MVPTNIDRWAPMQPSSSRRVHGAEFKAQVMAECQRPGASVAAVAMTHGLNVNLVRKWLVGRGLKRTGLVAPRAARSAVTCEPRTAKAPATAPSTPLQFLPVELSAPSAAAASAADDQPAAAIDIELRRADTELRVRWPAARAESCAAWLRECAAALAR